MTEEQTTTDETPAEEQPADSEVMGELHSLGQQLVTAVTSLWQSEESRKLREEIGDGFVQLGKEVDSAIKTAKESEAAKEFSEQVKETMEKAKESDVAAKVEEGLSTGLHQLNTELSKLVRSLETDKAPEQEADEASADAAVEDKEAEA